MSLKLLPLIALFLLITACSFAPPQNRYERVALSTRQATGPVAELHRKAITALAQNNSGEAIDLLHRAIKIQPRNPFSWHYLAQSYLQEKNFRKCIDMIERSSSYSAAAHDLERANRSLLALCENGLSNG